jgi:signal transduction histidine kinase
MKHAEPKTIRIRVWEAQRAVQIEVVDDGGGFRKVRSIDGGYGILGMKERAQNLGGVLTVRETRGRSGVVVRASLPLQASLPPVKQDIAEAIAS